jgi:iron(III) transport system substrate-binding protein
MTLDQLYNAAKAEGEVVAWGSTEPETMKALTAAFNARFPGITVTPFVISSDALAPRLIQESRTGRIDPDVVESSFIYGPLLDGAGLLAHSTDWVELFGSLGFPADAVELNGGMIRSLNNTYPVTYNTNLVKGADIPKKWEDLLDPKWRDNLIVENRLFPLGYLATDWGEERVVDFATKLREQQPKFVQGAANALQGLSSGQGAVAVGNIGYQVMGFKKQGAPIEIAATDVVGANTVTLAPLPGGKHPNAARLWVGWIASSEGQAVFSKVQGNGSITSAANTEEAVWYREHNVKIAVDRSGEIPTRARTAALKAMGL